MSVRSRSPRCPWGEATASSIRWLPRHRAVDHFARHYGQGLRNAIRRAVEPRVPRPSQTFVHLLRRERTARGNSTLVITSRFGVRRGAHVEVEVVSIVIGEVEMRGVPRSRFSI